MPGIVVFGRRWAVASDDFVFPAAGEFILRIAWLVALSVIAALYDDQLSSCPDGVLLRVYYIGQLILLSVLVVLSTVIVYVSSRGPMLDPLSLRRRLPVLLVIRTVLVVFDVTWAAVGTAWAFQSSVEAECPPSVVSVVQGAVIVGWIVLVGLGVGFVFIFDPLGRRRLRLRRTADQSSGGVDADNGSTISDFMMSSKRLWSIRCRIFCCCAQTSDQTTSAFKDVAELLADYFQDDDVVLSDIVASLILIHHRQRTRYSRLNTTLSPPSSTPQPGTRDGRGRPVPAWMSVSTAAHYMKFAGACYGWPFYVFDSLLCGPVRLTSKYSCCSCFRRHSSRRVSGDNCCMCNVSAILLRTGIDRTDIVYACFSNKVYETPFFVAIDHAHGSVVVSIRGTMSLSDAVTDLSACAESVPGVAVPDALAHQGMLRTANYVADYIRKNRILDTAFDIVPDYQLVITGHSLGAGTAAILACLLRNKYYDLKCFAFSPPGGLVSLPLSHHMDDFVFSVVVGNDIIPRLGLATMDHLKQEAIIARQECQQPKFRVLLGGAIDTLCCCLPETNSSAAAAAAAAAATAVTDEASVVYVNHGVTLPDDVTAGVTRENTRNACVSRSVHMEQSYSLYPPGRVLLLEEKCLTESSCCRSSYPIYSAKWTRPEQFDEIMVGSGMLSDHMPNRVQHVLDELVASLVTDDVLTFQ